MRYLLLAFITIPLVEMLLLFEVAERIGGLTTVALVVLTAVIGVQILKRQGWSTLLRAGKRLESGELPAGEIVEGMLLASAGALLLTPGFITDTAGFLFLTEPLRRAIARRVITTGLVRTAGVGGFHDPVRPGRSGAARGRTWEGEYSKESDEPGASGAGTNQRE